MSNVDSDTNKEIIGDGHDEENHNSEGATVKTEPLATRRSRRANAGNLMGRMIQDEEDEFYANLYGGFYEEEDDADFDSEGEGEGDADEDDGEDDGDDDGDEDSESSSEESVDIKQEQQDDEDDNQKTNRRKTAHKDSKPKRHSTAQADNSASSSIRPGSPSKAAYDSCVMICCVCLGDQTSEDEIIQCDACGVTVHDSCYGVAGQNDTTSVHSNISSESTEPWFCEPCRRSVRNPYCELCPNTKGIFKQTDTGRWVHMVCALYTRGVTFENIDTLTEVSLFELNYALYVSKVRIRNF